MSPATVLTKVTYWHFETSNFTFFLKKGKIFFINMGPYGSVHFKKLLLLKFYCFYISQTFHFFWMFPVTSTLWLIWKFQNSTPPRLSILFRPNLLWTFPVTGLTKSYLLAFWNFNFSTFLKGFNSRQHGALWGKFKNATPPTVMILFPPNYFWMFPVTVLTKAAYGHFEIQISSFFKKRLKFNILVKEKISKLY